MSTIGFGSFKEEDNELEPRNQADQHCLAPPAFKVERKIGTCFRCGMAVCRNCSTQ